MFKSQLGKTMLKTAIKVGTNASKVAVPLGQIAMAVDICLTIKKGVDELKKR